MKRFFLILCSLGWAAALLADSGSLVPPIGNGSGDMVSTNNLSDVVSAATSRTNLGATTVGANIFSLTNPGAITFLRMNANNTVTARSAANFLSDIGGIDGSALNANNLSSGTVPDARFPATLPAASGVNLTALNATNIGSGTVPDARFPATLPATAGTNLTGTGANFTAGNATKWTTGRTIAATGDVTYTSGSLDGSGNVTGAATVANVPITATFPADNTVVPTNTGGWTKYFVTGSDATTTGQSLVDITGMVSGTLSASTQYEVEIVIRAASSSAAGISVGIHVGGTGSPTVALIGTTNSSSTAAGASIAINGVDTASTAGLVYASSAGAIVLKGFVTTGTGTATISVQHLKVTSGTSTIKVGSVLKIKKADL